MRCVNIFNSSNSFLVNLLEDKTDQQDMAAGTANDAALTVQQLCGALASVASMALLLGKECGLPELQALLAECAGRCTNAAAAGRSMLPPAGDAPAGAGRWPALVAAPSQDQLVAVGLALATRPGCANLSCASCAGADERSMPRGQRCAGCLALRFCSAACQKAAWPRHRAACRLLKLAHAAG